MHIGSWIETIDDNLRIAAAVDRPNVGVMFHLHHWQAVGNRDHDKLRADFVKAKPYLMVVVIQGTDKDKATHKIVGEGTFDMAPLVRTLREMDYQGPLGTMGYTQSGDFPDRTSVFLTLVCLFLIHSMTSSLVVPPLSTLSRSLALVLRSCSYAVAQSTSDFSCT